MTELKTLKDLQGLSFRGECRLRQEAIKWIQPNTDCPIALTVNNWIKHFFNITDEELKA